MYKTSLRIEFLSDWHVGSGLGDGSIADAVLNRDINGIPRVPGTAVKGCLREGAWRLAKCDEASLGEMANLIFGTASQDRVSNQPGLVALGDGRLDKGIEDWLVAQPAERRKEFVADMTVIRAQTSLNADKTVVAGSLRSIECGIPGLVFNASLEADIPAEAEKWFVSYLNACCACAKSMGASRSRGLGRCVVALAERPPHIAIPGAPPACLLAAGRGEEGK